MDSKNSGFFWPSYVDIMTTMFAIMLVLFAVSYYRFQKTTKDLEEANGELQAVLEDYNNLITVYKTVNEIDSTSYFAYNEEYLKHLFTVNVEYQTREYRIDKLKLDLTDPNAADEKRDSIVDAGLIIQRTIQELEQSFNKGNSDVERDNIKFLIVIEGQSSKIPFDVDDWYNNYTLSYLRARFLDKFWKDNGIDLSSLPNCELLISGSGEGGVPRVNSNEPFGSQQWTVEEGKNQRFLINIVPVVGNIDKTLERLKSTNSRM